MRLARAAAPIPTLGRIAADIAQLARAALLRHAVEKLVRETGDHRFGHAERSETGGRERDMQRGLGGGFIATAW